MKYFLLLLFIAVTIVSCEDREPEEHIIPNWLKLRLQELESSGDCHGCTVQRSTYKEEIFYHLYCSHWSCSHCEVYRYGGVLVEWGEEFPLSEWLTERKKIEILWQCGDTLE